MESFDLLSTVEYGGCSAKLSPSQLSEVLSKLPKIKHENLLVDIETHDDAGVYKINDDTALIYTTDFFPPICSDATEYGRIAAANALSDVYAMGGTPIMALNLMMFPSSKIPMEVLADILMGGQEKANESGALVVGGHTIEDYPPKYGMAVVGTVHPDKLITNANAAPGDILILSKPIGTGALVAAQRLELVKEESYREALKQMMLLNKVGAEIMVEYGVKAATDVTGFGLAGHAYKMAESSHVSFRINSKAIPLLPDAYQIFEDGCIPGAAFRNLKYVGDHVEFRKGMDYNLKMLTCDAQTSGGLLMCVPPQHAQTVVEKLKQSGQHPQAAIIGEVLPESRKSLYVD